MRREIRALAGGHDRTRREIALVKFYYADGDWCYRAMQTVHAIFHKDGKLIARAERGDRNGPSALDPDADPPRVDNEENRRCDAGTGDRAPAAPARARVEEDGQSNQHEEGEDDRQGGDECPAKDARENAPPPPTRCDRRLLRSVLGTERIVLDAE